MEKFYNSLSPDELLEDSPSVGLPCVARYQADGIYYRAQIHNIKGQFAKVIFVDYGNEQYTPLKELKRIIPSFLQIPKLVSKFIEL